MSGTAEHLGDGTESEQDPTTQPGDEIVPPNELNHHVALDEGRNVEFKSSLRYDLKTGKVNRDLTKAVAKTVAGFLNSYGGTLLIGVADNGDVVGIERDIATLSKKNNDGFQLSFRDCIKNYLGAAVGPFVDFRFISSGNHTLGRVTCDPHPSPVFFQDGEARDFYVRDGNRTIPLDIRSAHEYINTHWSSAGVDLTSLTREILEAVQAHLDQTALLQNRLGVAPPPPSPPSEQLPLWLRVGTRRVLDLFLSNLSRSHGWKRINIVSPWLSEFGQPASMSFDQFLRRLRDDSATAYVVTRPPVEDWHRRAVELIGETGRANLVFVPNLHAKLYVAQTEVGAFALLGSANFTQQSLSNREVGVFVSAYAEGQRVVKELAYEAAELYRAPDRTLIYQAAF